MLLMRRLLLAMEPNVQLCREAVVVEEESVDCRRCFICSGEFQFCFVA
jgi:hypothetical protein